MKTYLINYFEQHYLLSSEVIQSEEELSDDFLTQRWYMCWGFSEWDQLVVVRRNVFTRVVHFKEHSYERFIEIHAITIRVAGQNPAKRVP